MGLIDSMQAGVNLANSFKYSGPMAQQDLNRSIYQNQQLQDQLQTYPDLLQAQLQLAKANGGIASAQAQVAPQMAQAGLTNANLINQYYGPTQQADIASKNAYASLVPYQASASLSSDPLAQMYYDRQRIIPPLMSPDGGMTIQPEGGGAPNGGINGGIAGSAMPQLPGGLTADQGKNVLSQLNNPAQSPSGMASMPSIDQMYQTRLNNMLAMQGKDPRMGSSRSGAGGTYLNPVTGERTSSDTTANTSKDQATIAALQRAAPIIQRLSDNLSPFQTMMGEGKLKFSQLANYVGDANTPLANKYAQGTSDLEVAPESLLKAWGLNVTDESLKRMQKAVEPKFGESPEGYQSRIINTLKDLSSNEKQAAERLSNGTELNNKSSPKMAIRKYNPSTGRIE